MGTNSFFFKRVQFLFLSLRSFTWILLSKHTKSILNTYLHLGGCTTSVMKLTVNNIFNTGYLVTMKRLTNLPTMHMIYHSKNISPHCRRWSSRKKPLPTCDKYVAEISYKLNSAINVWNYMPHVNLPLNSKIFVRKYYISFKKNVIHNHFSTPNLFFDKSFYTFEVK